MATPIAPYLEVPLPACSILIDRHTHKNGGSSLRSIYRANDLYHDFLLHTYGPTMISKIGTMLAAMVVQALAAGAVHAHGPGATRGVESHLHTNLSSGNCLLRAPLRYIMEHHYTRQKAEVLVDHFGPRSPLQRLAGVCECRVVLFTRIREPTSFYISFYRWTVWWRQQQNSTHFGRDLLQWAPPNLQSAIFLDPMSSAYAEFLGFRSEKRQLFNQFTEGDPRARKMRAQLRMLFDSFDLVGLVEKFDETLLLLADLTGLQHLLSGHEIPGTTNPRRPPPPTTDVCPDMDKCRARINIIAPIDTEIYEGVKADLDARIASYGPSFARRLAALRAARKAYGAKESEMKRRSSQPYHKFDGGWEVQKESLNMSRLRCPLGDSWAAVRVCRHAIAETPYKNHWRLTSEECCAHLRKCAQGRRHKVMGCKNWRIPDFPPSATAANITNEMCERYCAHPIDDSRSLVEQATGQAYHHPRARAVGAYLSPNIQRWRAEQSNPVCNNTHDFYKGTKALWPRFVSCTRSRRDKQCPSASTSGRVPNNSEALLVSLHCRRTCGLCGKPFPFLPSNTLWQKKEGLGAPRAAVGPAGKPRDLSPTNFSLSFPRAFSTTARPSVPVLLREHIGIMTEYLASLAKKYRFVK